MGYMQYAASKPSTGSEEQVLQNTVDPLTTQREKRGNDKDKLEPAIREYSHRAGPDERQCQ